MLKRYLVEPIPEIAMAARTLSDAADAHLAGDTAKAANLFKLADDPLIWAFTDAAWGSGARKRNLFTEIAGAPPHISRPDRPLPRMPTPATQRAVLERDGYFCRFCGIPVISAFVRKLMQIAYPEAVKWPATNLGQHAAFQCMWLQFDHIIPNSRGGRSDLENVVVTCAPCNFGRMEYTLEEAGLMHPLQNGSRVLPLGLGDWDGLERLRYGPKPTKGVQVSR